MCVFSHGASKYSDVHYFAYDTSLLHFNSCMKSVSKQVIYDLKSLANWLKAIRSLDNLVKLSLCFLLHLNNKLTVI